MVDEKWQKVREIFDSALRRKPEERRKYVHEACAEDKLLLAEVESPLIISQKLKGLTSSIKTRGFFCVCVLLPCAVHQKTWTNRRGRFGVQ